MYARAFPRVIVAMSFLIALVSVTASAQSAAPAPTPVVDDGHPGHDGHGVTLDQNQPAPHDMTLMGHGAMPAPRDGSGTSWQPDETPMYGVHRALGEWTLMLHGNAFLQTLHESGDRGDSQTGSINWLMLMADRSAVGGHLSLRGMVSAEAWTIGGCGYPDLLASGEVCDGAVIHDRQHPHDALMELAGEYDRSLGGPVHLQIYGGFAGEPALGPVAFPHRLSAMSNPLAPIGHHWFDATHVSYGVVTAGLFTERWKIEASAFNGREPDEDRTDVDLGSLNSWSGRVWWLPTRRWALQFSGGRLHDAEERPDGERTDVDRLTASATYHARLGGDSFWATTAGWGRNAAPDESATHAVLLESAFSRDDRHTWFTRLEVAHKSDHDLALEDHGIVTVGKVQGGYSRYFRAWHGWQPGIGGTVSASIVPERLTATYGRRVNAGGGVYLTLRAAAQSM
jgi:hypothetical protein